MPKKIVGEAREIAQEDVEYEYHTCDNPAEEALMIHDLREAGMTQKEIAKKMGISQAQVSKRLSLLELPRKLFERVLEGELAPSTAYQLSKLPDDQQAQFVDEEKTTLKSVEDLRKSIQSEALVKLIESDQPWSAEYEVCPRCMGFGRIKRRDDTEMDV